MPRPPRQRVVAGEPVATIFKPAGIRTRDLQWMNLTLDEFEAIRLIDAEGLDQEAAAIQMSVSRPTVTRILASARTKVARALVTGQALLIEGGPVIMGCQSGRGRRRNRRRCEGQASGPTGLEFNAENRSDRRGPGRQRSGRRGPSEPNETKRDKP